jgi:antitoxin ChpS
MSIATLRAVGGSVVMAIPKRLLELVHLQVGSQVNIDIQQGKLIVAPIKKKHYSLTQLLAQCDASLPISTEERDCLDAPTVGLENQQVAR